MTRELPIQPSPQFLSNAMVFRKEQPNPTKAPQTPKNRRYGTRSISKTPIKIKRPTYNKMIEEAVFENTVKRKGTSLYTIKKYLQKKYEVDVKKSAKRICKCIREATSKGGNLRQVTGCGANGRFALVSPIQKKLQIEKEKVEKSTITIFTRSSKTKSDSFAPVNKRKEQKSSKANSRQTNTPVTRMRVN